ncbi:hypothetical protein KKC87_01085, partial [Patescibacteria group bacterium]|nr:hypothetical protein [Patescibacteria group bacterium]
MRQFVVDRLFPIFCVECGQEGEWWCEKCRRKIKIKPITQGADGFLDGLTAFFNYAEGAPLAKLIHEYKYSFARDIEKLWLRLLSEAQYSVPMRACHFEEVLACRHPELSEGSPAHRRIPSSQMHGKNHTVVERCQDIFAIIPIPLHPLRQRERGFNQSEIFAKIILQELQDKSANTRLENKKFIRARNTRQQAKLSKAEREENISDAFLWQDPM